MTKRDTHPTQYELRFRSLFHAGRAYAFPCDAAGNVRTDLMSESALQRLVQVRERVGLDFDIPTIVQVH